MLLLELWQRGNTWEEEGAKMQSLQLPQAGLCADMAPAASRAQGSPGQPLLQCHPSLLGALGLLLHPLEPVRDPVHVGVHSWGGRAQSLGEAGTPE